MSDQVYVDGVTVFQADAANDFNRLHYTLLGDPADIAAVRAAIFPVGTRITNSLGSDVALSNTGTYFDGPSCAQGTAGTWLALGKVTITDTTGQSTFQVKLWDGTTVIDSASDVTTTTSAPLTVALSGFLASPAANIRISVKDISFATGLIKFNASGNSKDSTLNVFRIN